MFVKNLTAVGKSSLLIFSLLLASCTSYNPNTSHSIVSGTGSGYHTADSVLLAGQNWLKSNYYNCPLTTYDASEEEDSVETDRRTIV